MSRASMAVNHRVIGGVRLRPLAELAGLVWLAEPDGTAPAPRPGAWWQAHRHAIDTLLRRVGGLLFRGFDLPGPGAFAGLNAKTPTILLSHQPTVLDLEQTQNVSLILSGHTHGGQVKLPFLGAPVRYATNDLKYARGLFRRGSTQLYVSSGTGVIGLPVRFGVRPEIAVLRLKREI